MVVLYDMRHEMRNDKTDRYLVLRRVYFTSVNVVHFVKKVLICLLQNRPPVDLTARRQVDQSQLALLTDCPDCNGLSTTFQTNVLT